MEIGNKETQNELTLQVGNKETQEELHLSVGSEEAISLKPAVVKIVGVRIEELGAKKSHKVACICKHPDREETISISSVKYENKGKLEVTGLWINKDSTGMIRKGSALALFMQKLKAANVEELNNKDVETVLDEKQYLTFKNY